jgi:hypothetical protein
MNTKSTLLQESSLSEGPYSSAEENKRFNTSLDIQVDEIESYVNQVMEARHSGIVALAKKVVSLLHVKH